MILLWLFWQILISYCKFLMPRPLKWGILGAGTIILSGDIQNFILYMVRIFMNQTLETMHFFVIIYDQSLWLGPNIWLQWFFEKLNWQSQKVLLFSSASNQRKTYSLSIFFAGFLFFHKCSFNANDNHSFFPAFPL